jgi:hypothetical protein
MEQTLFFSIVGTFILILLAIIGFFLKRIAEQYDAAQENHNQQFDKLLKKFDVLTEIIYEHKSDVEVIKEQINTHNRALNSIDVIYDRLRVVETDLSIFKSKAA